MLIIDWINEFRESVLFQNLLFLAPYIGGTFMLVMIISSIRKMMKMPSKKDVERMKQIRKNLPRN